MKSPFSNYSAPCEQAGAGKMKAGVSRSPPLWPRGIDDVSAHAADDTCREKAAHHHHYQFLRMGAATASPAPEEPRVEYHLRPSRSPENKDQD